MGDAGGSEGARSASGLRRRDVLRRGVVASGVFGLAGCVSTTDDGISIEFDRSDDTPADVSTGTPANAAPETATDSPTPTAYPTPSFSQDCLELDPEGVEIEEAGGGFRLVDGDAVLLSFDEFDHAKAARDVVTGYGFTRQCFVGRPDPPFEYWLVDDSPPGRGDASPLESEDCLSLDPDSIAVEEDGRGGYRIVYGESVLLAFDELENANRTRDLIRHYGFTRQCFVGRPDPPFEYWLADD